MAWLDSITKYLHEHGADLALRALIAIVVFLVVLVLGRLLASWGRRALAKGHGETLGGLVSRLIGVTSLVVGLVMALDHLGVDVATILAGAGIIGLAVGFGSQTLVKDLISGFFIIFDGAIAVGDVAEVGTATGVVESVGLRTTQLRSFNGQLWYIPNGEIRAVGNFNRDWMRCVVEVGLAYEQDAAKGIQVLQGVGDAWAQERSNIVLEPPEAQGVMGLNASDVGVRLVIKVKAGEHWAAERELRARIKAAFDASGVEIPFPRQLVYVRKEEGNG